MRKKKDHSRDDVMREILELALCPVNDAVKLCYLSEPGDTQLNRLDLRGLTEFKRGANGNVELKFTDRLRALECLLAQMENGKEERAEAFLRALEDPAVSP